MRLFSLALIDKAVRCLGLKLLIALEENGGDLFQTLLRLYGLYPFNDMALSYVTSILAHALDYDIADELEKEQNYVEPKKPSFLRFSNFRFNDDDDGDSEEDDSDKKEDEEDEIKVEVGKQEKEKMLVHMLFKTDLVHVLINACMKRCDGVH